MKHLKVVSKAPRCASDEIPVDVIIDFVVALLTAVASLLAAKEATG